MVVHAFAGEHPLHRRAVESRTHRGPARLYAIQIPPRRADIDRASELGWEDFEDAPQMAMAEENPISLLVKGSLNDFQSTPKVKIVSAGEFLKTEKNVCGWL